jgi:hypothetical protein
MAAEDNTVPPISVWKVDVSPVEVDAGADITLKCEVSGRTSEDLRGKTLLIKDQDAGVAANVRLTEFDGETNQTSDFIVTAPLRPGTYTWVAQFRPDVPPGDSDEETSASFSFTVKPHSTRVVVWDTPSTIETGKDFDVKFGVKCSSQCPPDLRSLEVYDHEGEMLATRAIGDEVWPETAGLYYAQIGLRAPETEGLHRWEARVPASASDIPHAEGIASFSVRVVPAPECVLTVEAIDVDNRTPVEGAKVVVHPYRAFTDENGMAQMRVPKGEYRLFVSGKNYSPFRATGEMKSDISIRAELTLDVGLSDADVWS